MSRRLRLAVPVAGFITASLLFTGYVQAAGGELDPAFSRDGKVATDVAIGWDRAEGVAIQTDGRIVVAGSSGTRIRRFTLLRYNTDGTLDAAFGVDGKVTTGFGARGASAFGLAIQVDGKIVAAGSAGTQNSKFALTRYNPDGSLDVTFGDGGRVTTSLTDGSDRAAHVAIQADGGIVAAGTADDDRRPKFALVRYDVDGHRDTSFGTNGTVITNVAEGYDHASAVAIQADEKIVVFGRNGCDFALVRYDPEGTLDSSFGDGGKVTSGAKGFLCLSGEDVAIQPDGKIIAAGWGECLSSILPCLFDVAVARYNTDGTPDMSFGEAGHVRGGYYFALGNAVSIQTDGKIVAVGAVDFNSGFALVRYNSDGTADPTFGEDGKVTTVLGRQGAAALDVAIQADGKILAAGWSLAKNGRFAAVRYLAS